MDCRQTTPDEVDKSLYFKLNRIIHEALQQDFVALTEDLEITLSESDDVYIATILYVNGNDKIPVLTTMGTANESSTDILWQNANDFYNDIFPGFFKKTRFEVGAPLILDLVIPAPVPLNIYLMTGDISRCIGWMLLSPESIRSYN